MDIHNRFRNHAKFKICISVIFLLTASFFYYRYNHVSMPKFKKLNETVWFMRKFACSKGTCAIDKIIDEEWKVTSSVVDENNLWIPVSDYHSLLIEKGLQKWFIFSQTCTPGLRASLDIDESCDVKFPFAMKTGALVMNRMYRASVRKSQVFFAPIFWADFHMFWSLKPCDYVFEVPHSPPVLYFADIETNKTMKSFFQPVPLKYTSQITKAEYIDMRPFLEDSKVNITRTSVVVQGKIQLDISVDHIRDGITKEIKKFHPTFTMPTIIPIAWRHNLSTHDEKLLNSHLIRPEFLKQWGLVFNDIFYYLSEHKEDIINELSNEMKKEYETFKSDNEDYNGTVSILAHSLGSVIAFDALNRTNYATALGFEVENLFLIGSPLGRFLHNRKTTAKDLNQYHWIKTGRLFNILHSDDPVAHRLETLFDDRYKYVKPAELYLPEMFRKNYGKSLEISEFEAKTLATFHHHLNREKKLAPSHDSFITIDYLSKSFGFSLNTSLTFEEALSYLKEKFPSKNITSAEMERILPTSRIPHRFDYDIYKTEYDVNEYQTLDVATKFIKWAVQLPMAHLSYWDRPEVVALMINVIFNVTGDEVKYEETDDHQLIDPYPSQQEDHYPFYWDLYNNFEHFLRCIFGILLIGHIFLFQREHIPHRWLRWISYSITFYTVFGILHDYFQMKKYFDMNVLNSDLKIFLFKMILAAWEHKLIMILCLGVMSFLIQWKEVTLIYRMLQMIFYYFSLFLLYVLPNSNIIAIFAWNIKQYVPPQYKFSDKWIIGIYMFFFIPVITKFFIMDEFNVEPNKAKKDDISVESQNDELIKTEEGDIDEVAAPEAESTSAQNVEPNEPEEVDNSFKTQAKNFLLFLLKYRTKIFRIFKSYLFVLFIFWAIATGIEWMAFRVRSHELNCVHPLNETICREYILFDNGTKTIVSTRNEQNNELDKLRLARFSILGFFTGAILALL